MSKFKIGDRVEVTNEENLLFGAVGNISAIVNGDVMVEEDNGDQFWTDLYNIDFAVPEEEDNMDFFQAPRVTASYLRACLGDGDIMFEILVERYIDELMKNISDYVNDLIEDDNLDTPDKWYVQVDFKEDAPQNVINEAIDRMMLRGFKVNTVADTQEEADNLQALQKEAEDDPAIKKALKDFTNTQRSFFISWSKD